METSARVAFGNAVQLLLDDQGKQGSPGEHLLRILFCFLLSRVSLHAFNPDAFSDPALITEIPPGFSPDANHCSA